MHSTIHLWLPFFTCEPMSLYDASSGDIGVMGSSWTNILPYVNPNNDTVSFQILNTIPSSISTSE